tara:strand:+ start:448 stop:936 length:489 start_codon:yes stop_codon:yes gene_type:complete
MSSTLFVDAIEPNLSSGVHIPGHVVQVVKASSTASTSLSSPAVDTWTSVNPSISITPKYNNSMIIIHHYAGGLANNTAGTKLRLLRNGSPIVTNDRHSYVDSANIWMPMSWTSVWTDTPSTTSALTYTLQIGCQASTGGLLRHNDYQATANTAFTIAMEIAQ